MIDALSEMSTNLLNDLPRDILGLREMIREKRVPDTLEGKSNAAMVKLDGNGYVATDPNSVYIRCGPLMVYSSAHLEYEDKPRNFKVSLQQDDLCKLLKEKERMVEKALSID